jgi:hypothetical protein
MQPMMVSAPRLADDHAEVIWPLLATPRKSHECVVWSRTSLSGITATTPRSSELEKNQKKRVHD